MTPRVILAALIASSPLAALLTFTTIKNKPPYTGGPFCQYPTPQHVDYPMCEWKLRSVAIVNNG